jgi:hypothetical protein
MKHASRGSKKYLLRAAFCTVLTVGAVSTVAVPANAAMSDCPSGYTCLWADTDFQTEGSGAKKISFARYIPDLSLWSYSGSPVNGANTASSVFNNGNVDNVYLYAGTYKSGRVIATLPPKGWVKNLDTFGRGDDIESGYFESFL